MKHQRAHPWATLKTFQTFWLKIANVLSGFLSVIIFSRKDHVLQAANASSATSEDITTVLDNELHSVIMKSSTMRRDSEKRQAEARSRRPELRPNDEYIVHSNLKSIDAGRMKHMLAAE